MKLKAQGDEITVCPKKLKTLNQNRNPKSSSEFYLKLQTQKKKLGFRRETERVIWEFRMISSIDSVEKEQNWWRRG